MQDITYESIKALIKKEEMQGSTLYCTFACDETGITADGSAAVRQGTGSAMMQTVRDSASRNLMFQIKRSVAQSIHSMFGYSLLGNLGRDLVYSTTSGRSSTNQHVFSDAEKQEAAVEAFRAVSNRFRWDTTKSRWVGLDITLLLPYTQQINTHPVTNRYDLSVMARMLAELAAADGHVSQEEKVFIRALIPEQLGQVEDLLGQTALTRVEMEETTQGPVRETMLMLAFALACADNELAAAEIEKLNGFAENLGIPTARRDELKHHAQQYIIDVAFEQLQRNKTFATGHDEVHRIAQGIGLSDDDAMRMEVQFKKRNGIF